MSKEMLKRDAKEMSQILPLIPQKRSNSPRENNIQSHSKV